MPAKKDFRKELEKLIAKHEDSELVSHIANSLKEYDHAQYMKQSQPPENPYGVDLNKMPQVNNQPIPVNVGNTTTSGWSNPFGGTSWGV